MAVRATAGFGILRYDPGNPEFPTLPDGIIVGHQLTFPDGGGSRRYRLTRPLARTRNVKASAPANDDERYAGWQTETTWVNPAIIDFGVIPSPVQRTVSLYNARSTSVSVTALALPTGVTLVGPALPGTLLPYAGITFTLEAGVTGDNTFDEFVFFETSEGNVTFRILGRRVFALDVIPQTPIPETLIWRTDLIRSTDGSEKAYSLLRAPSTEVDYMVMFQNDLQRMKFKNNFIAGESALVVAGQKWWEARRLVDAATALDTTLNVDTNVIDASWEVGGPISVVTEDGEATGAQVDSFEVGPDPYLSQVIVLVRWDGADGSQVATDLSSKENAINFNAGTQISTAQSKFGGASLLLGGTQTEGVDIGADFSQEFLDNDWTIDLWIRPTAADITNNPALVARFDAFAGPGRSWVLYLRSDRIRFDTEFPNQNSDFVFGSPREIQADTWHYLRVCRVGDLIYCFVDGVQVGTSVSFLGSIGSDGTGSPYLTTTIGNYYNSGFRAPYRGYIDDLRITLGTGRSTVDFTPPTERHPDINDTYLTLTLGAALGLEAPANSFVMPVGLGYVKKFPEYSTYRDNLEVAQYTLLFNREEDFSNLDTEFFTTLTDQQSPANTLPVLEFCNETDGNTKSSNLARIEDVLDSGLSNRIAFSEFPFGDNVSSFKITLNSASEVWAWRTFLHYLRGSYGEFYIPTFTDDLPGATTAASNVFDVEDTDLALLFGNPPDPRRNAIRLQYPDGTIMYRFITQVIDNVATEEITVDSAVQAGNPKISYLQRCRILGDTVTFEHSRSDYAVLKFKFRTVLL